MRCVTWEIQSIQLLRIGMSTIRNEKKKRRNVVWMHRIWYLTFILSNLSFVFFFSSYYHCLFNAILLRFSYSLGIHLDLQYEWVRQSYFPPQSQAHPIAHTHTVSFSFRLQMYQIHEIYMSKHFVSTINLKIFCKYVQEIFPCKTKSLCKLITL